ncbi:MAG: relaxase MobL [Bacilli bacterium]|nr:relaxase MobL [Bacilli bacterium]MDD4808464.1 relaxase MobL [Bacilli bacterium]
MIDTAKVVVVNDFTPSYKQLNSKYPTKSKIYNSAMHMFDYFSNEKKKAYYMLDYFSGKLTKEKEMNIIFEDGNYATKEEIEKRKLEYTKYIEKSNIYKLIISFPEEYLENSVDIRKFEKELMLVIIPRFLKYCGFKDVAKISYQVSLHNDTDNKHFHFSFAEKRPNYKIGDKLDYRYRGMLTLKELAFFKNEILHHIKKEKIYTQLLTNLNKEVDEFKSYFNKNDKNFILNDKANILIENKIIRLGELLFERNLSGKDKIKYNSLKSKEIKNLTRDIKNQILKKELKNQYRGFQEAIDNINEYYKSLSKENRIKISDDTLLKNKKQYLDNYVLNAIVNYANNSYNPKKISEDNLIQSMVLKTYVKSKSTTKGEVLKNYLSNVPNNKQFINKYKVRHAVKNINYELEEAMKEFDKLFESSKDYSV